MEHYTVSLYHIQYAVYGKLKKEDIIYKTIP